MRKKTDIQYLKSHLTKIQHIIYNIVIIIVII